LHRWTWFAVGVAFSAGGLATQSFAADAPADTATTPCTPAKGQGATFLSCSHPELAGSFDVDASIPDAPGFAVIGVSPTQIVDPSSTRITFASLINYLDENGKLKPGVALGGSPYWWFNPRETLKSYQDAGGFEHVIARTTVSVGYAASEANSPTRVGLGFHTDLLDAGDYRMDRKLYDCVGNAAKAVIDLVDHDDTVRAALTREAQDVEKLTTDSQITEYVAKRLEAARTKALAESSADFAPAVAACQKVAKDRYSARQSLVFAGGLAIKSVGGKQSTDGGSLWLTYRHPLAFGALSGDADVTKNYFTVFGRYDFDKTRDIPAGGSQGFNRGLFALLIGYESGNVKLSAQGGYETDRYKGVGPFISESFGFFSVAADYRLSGGVWIGLKAGSKDDSISRAAGKNSYAVVDLHWALAPAAVK
jgi:hypothetical protein